MSSDKVRCVYVGGVFNKIEEAYNVFLCLGYKIYDVVSVDYWWIQGAEYLVFGADGSYIEWSSNIDESWEVVSIDQLIYSTVLNRNDVNDATHYDYHRNVWLVIGENKYRMQDGEWELSGDAPSLLLLKPIEKPMKEYLNPEQDYALCISSKDLTKDGFIEVPDGANMYAYFDEYEQANFYKGDFDAIWQGGTFWDYDMNDYKTYCKKECKVLWSRNNTVCTVKENSIESDMNKEGKIKMKSVIHKYPIPFQEGFELNLPKGSKVVRVDTVDGFAFLWALHEVATENTEVVTYKFASSKTGGVIEHEKPLTFIGTYAIFVQMELMLYVFLEDIVDTNGNSILSEYDVNQSTCWRG